MWGPFIHRTDQTVFHHPGVQERPDEFEHTLIGHPGGDARHQHVVIDPVEKFFEVQSIHADHAPWYLVPANQKNYSRLAVFSILIDRLGQGVDLSPKPLDPRLAEAAAELLTAKG